MSRDPRGAVLLMLEYGRMDNVSEALSFVYSNGVVRQIGPKRNDKRISATTLFCAVRRMGVDGLTIIWELHIWCQILFGYW